MKLGFIGLGRMGLNLVLNALDNHEIVVYNRSPEKVKEAANQGAISSFSIEEMINKLPDKKIVWLMVTAGKPVDDLIQELVPHLSKGDLIIDGGNSWFEDSIRRSKHLAKKGVLFLDCGTSGGVSGARNGACMMIGGPEEALLLVKDFVNDVCVQDGYAHVGSAGAGHFVKMVHNGIEYGMMAAMAEGMSAIDKHKSKLSLKTKDIARVYSHGSIVEGKLATLLEKVVNRPDFSSASGSVPKGETEDEMAKLERLSKMPILEEARKMRIRSRNKESYEGKIMALLRNEFGGHALKK